MRRAGTAPAPDSHPAVAAAVALRRVSRFFGGQPAVQHVTMTVDRGEVVWLCGPNGSGKSTLLRVIGTALSPTYGGGSVLGHDLVGGRSPIRARIDLLGHHGRLYEDLTAAENLRFACALYGLRTDKVLSALEAVGLDEVADVRAGDFSQGMRQRLALARCRMRDPELLLLDEPYAGLDAEARVVVEELLRDARARGRTVLLASHEPPAPELVDRTVLLEAGRLVTGSVAVAP